MSRGRRRRSSSKKISNVSSIFLKPIDKIALIRADQIREGRRMMAAEKGAKWTGFLT